MHIENVGTVGAGIQGGSFDCPATKEQGSDEQKCYSPPVRNGNVQSDLILACPTAAADFKPGAAFHTIRYSPQCIGDDYFLVGDERCFSLPLDQASKCAFGLGDACRNCPLGGQCPGGFEVWPFPGFYTNPGMSQQGRVKACREPRSERQGQTSREDANTLWSRILWLLVRILCEGLL